MVSESIKFCDFLLHEYCWMLFHLTFQPYKRSTIGNPAYDRKLHSSRSHPHSGDPLNQNREYAEIDPSIYSLPLSQNQPIKHSKPYENIDENEFVKFATKLPEVNTTSEQTILYRYS